MSDSNLAALDALVRIALRLAASAPSGRFALARLDAAIDRDWLPQPWGEDIATALADATQAACRPIEARQVQRALSEAWGGKPLEELDELDLEQPVAITPTAQVHRGVLDGRPVAVKVLRPGLAASVRQDLSLLESLLGPLSAAFPALDPAAMLREVRERVLDELDLEQEATTQRHFHRALRRHPFLTVPAPVTRLAHEGVLVSEWVEGVPIAQAPQEERDRAAARLLVFVVGAARNGVVHADPDPDDVLLTRDGRLAILDFGASRRVVPERWQATTEAARAFDAEDADALGRALDKLGWLPAGLAPTALALGLNVLGPLHTNDPVRLDSAAVIGCRDRLLRSPRELGQILAAGSLAPEDLWPARGLAQLFGTIARVGATGRWRDLLRDALDRGWDAGT